MKCLVETKDSCQLVTPMGELAAFNRPSVLSKSGFVASRLEMGHLSMVEDNLSDEASDAEFQKYLKDSKGDAELAAASFAEKYGVKAKKKPGPKPKAK